MADVVSEYPGCQFEVALGPERSLGPLFNGPPTVSQLQTAFGGEVDDGIRIVGIDP